MPGLERYTLVSVDLPGFGESPRTEAFTFETVAERLAALAGAHSTILVGHSLGGRIGMQVAERTELRGLVVVDSWLLEQDDELLRVEDTDAWFDAFLAECDGNAGGDVALTRYVQGLRRLDRRAYFEAGRELERHRADTMGLYVGLSVPRAYVAAGGAPEEALAVLEREGLEVRRFADAGHAVMVDEPLAFYAFLQGWVGRLA